MNVLQTDTLCLEVLFNLYVDLKEKFTKKYSADDTKYTHFVGLFGASSIGLSTEPGQQYLVEIIINFILCKCHIAVHDTPN